MKHKHSIVHALLLMLVALALGICEASSQEKGSIHVIAPPGIQVLLDGKLQGETNAALGGLTLDSVSLGIHRISVLKEGFPAQERIDTVQKGYAVLFPVQPFGPTDIVDQEEYPPLSNVRHDEEPTIVKRAEAEFPKEALQQGLDGKVFVTFWITKEGTVKQVVVLRSSHKVFNAPSIAAVKQWRFTPARMKGEPVASWASVPFKFKLNR